MRAIVLFLVLAMPLTALAVAPTAAAAPPCRSGDVAVPTGIGDVGVKTNDDCSREVYAFRGIHCVGPWGTHISEQAGPVQVDVWMCTPPGSDPAPMQCKDPFATDMVTVGPDCHVTVSVDLVDCLWRERWNTHTVGPLTVRYTTCDDGST